MATHIRRDSTDSAASTPAPLSAYQPAMTAFPVPFGLRTTFLFLYNAFLFWLFLFNRSWGIGFTLFEIFHLLPHVISWLQRSGSDQNSAAPSSKYSLYFLGKVFLAVAVSVVFWVRAYGDVQFLALLSVGLLNLSLLYELETGQLMPLHYFWSAVNLWIAKILYFTHHSFLALTTWQKDLKKVVVAVDNQALRRVIVGGIIAIPMLFVLSMLFASADQNFAELLKSVIQNFSKFFEWFNWLKNLDWIWPWVLQFGAFWLYLCLVFPAPWRSPAVEKSWKDHLIEILTASGLVTALFAVFLFTQIKSTEYILHGFSTGQINPGAFVREGFAQLFIACVIGSGLFILLKRNVHVSLAKKLQQVGLYTAIILLLEILLVSFAAGERLYLYRWAYGFTRARIWGFFGLIGIWVVVVTLAGQLFHKITIQATRQIFLISLASVVLLAGVINIDYQVGVVQPPQMNGTTDWTYISGLSYDSADAWVSYLSEVNAGTFSGCKDAVKNGQTVRVAQCLANLNTYRPQYEFLTNWQFSNQLTLCEKDNLKKITGMSWNMSVATHGQMLCSHYLDWQTFKNDYDSLKGQLDRTQQPLTLKVFNISYIPMGVTPANDPNAMAQQLAAKMATGTKYLGSGPSAINYQIVKSIRIDSAPPKQTVTAGNSTYQRTSLDAILDQNDICNKLNSGAINEVWVWVNGVNEIAARYDISGPNIQQWHYMKSCGNKTLTLMNFDYSKPVSEALLYMADRMDSIARNIDGNSYQEFVHERGSVNSVATSPAVFGCGSGSSAPNLQEVDNYHDQGAFLSDCQDWNPNRTGKVETLSCTTWGCNDEGYAIWWMQHIPGLGNSLKTRTGGHMTNWWEAFGDYDTYIAVRYE